eukprot:248183-Chlamydomonas_euryale.AAC.10
MYVRAWVAVDFGSSGSDQMLSGILGQIVPKRRVLAPCMHIAKTAAKPPALTPNSQCRPQHNRSTSMTASCTPSSYLLHA